MLLFAAQSYAQKETVNVIVTGDTVRIVNVGAWENCAARFAIRIDIAGNTILMTECDTVVQKARCMCTFDVLGQLSGLAAGSYEVTVQRQYLTRYNYPADTTVVIGTARFDILTGGAVVQLMKNGQSPCYNLTDIESPTPGSALAFDAFPNPGAQTTTLRIVTPLPGNVRVDMYDLLGRLQTTITDAYYSAGVHEITTGPENFPLIR
jgi:hypothetical protein